MSSEDAQALVPNYLLFIWRYANVNFLERLYEPSNLMFAKVVESILWTS